MAAINNKFKGTGVALVTPFHKDNSVDFKSLGKLVNHVIDGGVDYLVALGTTGESVTLNKEEKSAIVNYIIEINEKRLPLVVGLGGNNTQDILNCLPLYDCDGIDGILSVSPYYNKPNQRGIYQHFKVISNNCPKPLIIYNVPARTGSNISSETTLKLANEFKNIIGIKEASGNLEQIMKIIKNKPAGFSVISGDDNLALSIVACGGDGVISVVANAFPKQFSAMIKNALSDNFKEARKLHYKHSEIIEQIFADGNPTGIKAVLEMLKIGTSTVRLPLVKISKVAQRKTEEILKNYLKLN